MSEWMCKMYFVESYTTFISVLQPLVSTPVYLNDKEFTVICIPVWWVWFLFS